MEWDEYFMGLCKAYSAKSPCLSRQIGSIVVIDNRIVSAGYNGPPIGFPHCGQERLQYDEKLVGLIYDKLPNLFIHDVINLCPRKILGFKSGEAINLCFAAHAERNAIANAARIGVPLKGGKMYLNTMYPCFECAKEIVNAGIIEVISAKNEFYDYQSEMIFKQCGIKLRCYQK